MNKDAKWEGCPFDVVYHEKTLRAIEVGTYPDPSGSGKRYHGSRIVLAYEWLKEKRESDILKGIYY